MNFLKCCFWCLKIEFIILSQMENKTPLSKCSSHRPIQRRISQNFDSNIEKQFFSPRLIKRKPDNKRKDSFKLKKSQSKELCYISPKKDIEDSISRNQMSRSRLTTTKMFQSIIFSDIENKDIMKDKYRRADGFRQSSHNNAVDKLQIEKLKAQNTRLEKKLKETQKKLSRLQQQNTYCLVKIEEFAFTLKLKSNEINLNLEQINKKDKQIIQLNKKNIEKDDEIVKLSQTVDELNKVIKQKESNLSETDDSEKLNDLTTELQQYKKVNMELAERIKYYMIQQDIRKKLLHSLQQEQSKNQKLRFMNKRMSEKLAILSLSKTGRKKKSKHEIQKSISLELSPGK